MDIKGFSKKANEDIKLVKSAQNNNENAYAELLKRYRDSIYFMLLRMVNNPIDAEDLTIEAFGKAFKNIDKYSPEFAFSTWLFKIASNNCIDFLRKNRNNEFSFHANSDDLTSTDSENKGYYIQLESKQPLPDEILIIRQKAKTLRKVVEGLKPRYKKLVELRYFEELSYDEIAKELDIPLGTVKAQLFRARELLFNILKNKRKLL